MMTNLHTTQKVADALGISIPRVKQLAVNMQLGQKVGRDWVFTDEDVERMRQRDDGRRRQGESRLPFREFPGELISGF